ncbi:MFS transporter [Stenotrophomonas sp. MMGLT7]|uniref:MFS transporter n=1 Tax=Stenotrophomonas sp. MMGLT7 TaxID=2901227 RepID=UPI001E5632E2|nr:MFS transporter [Stenotrophomonas sp. MMGLT7]MCD7096843.1 MFS transporter [Stenotrophomonas sp. MMGLT7]
MSHAAAGAVPAAPGAASKGSPPQPVFGPRLAAGLFGIFLAAMMAGLNNRVGGLGLVDVRGALGFAQDDASWLGTAYAAGELVAMPFATWFAITMSLRRFHLAMLCTSLALALLLPLVHNLPLLLALRALQGVASGALIPLLMMAALRFLPPPIRLHGLALYSMTATFAPNLAVWLAGQWSDQWHDWRLIYWHIVPLGLLAVPLVAWGIPAMPPAPARWKGGNWFGMACAVVGLSLLTVGLDQGVRLDWLRSPLVAWALACGLALTALYLFTEWWHPAPFIKLQLLRRRNLWLGFTIFVGLLVVMASSAALPAAYLGAVQGYRPLQSAPLGLIVGLPQLLVAPAVALLLYRKWVDARKLMALGLALMALACWLGARLTADWTWGEFAWAQVLQCLGQPMAVVSLLFLATSVVQPMEGPYVAGTVNALRALGTLLGGALISQLVAVRGRFHAEMLLDLAGLSGRSPAAVIDPATLATLVPQQSLVLATADGYRVLAVLALLLIPLALRLQHIPAPTIAAVARVPATPAATVPSSPNV